MADRIVSPKTTDDEGKFELSLRPKRLAEYIGQDKIKQNLASCWKPPKRAAKRLITFCCTVHRVSARRRWRTSSRTK